MSNDLARFALVAPVKQQPLNQATKELGAGQKKVIYFGTNATTVAPAGKLAKTVYFKLTGQTKVTMCADFVALTTKNIPACRLKGCENEQWKYYYGFTNLRPLPTALPLSDLRQYPSEKPLRNDFPSPRIIFHPDSLHLPQ